MRERNTTWNLAQWNKNKTKSLLLFSFFRTLFWIDFIRSCFLLTRESPAALGLEVDFIFSVKPLWKKIPAKALRGRKAFRSIHWTISQWIFLTRNRIYSLLPRFDDEKWNEKSAKNRIFVEIVLESVAGALGKISKDLRDFLWVKYFL